MKLFSYSVAIASWDEHELEITAHVNNDPVITSNNFISNFANQFLID